MKKVILAVLFVFVLCVALASCGKNNDEHIHSFGEWETVKSPTCTDAGQKARYCSCGEEQTAAIEAIGHNYEGATCKNCGGVNPVLCTHENVAIIPAVDSTWTTAGLTEGTRCADCNLILTAQKELPLVDHTPEDIEESKDPSCTETGFTGGSRCSVCEKILISPSELPKIPHTYTNDNDETCDVCGFVRDTKCAHINIYIIN